MSNPQGTMVVEIDLKKKQLEQEILQLERELERQERKGREEALPKNKTRAPITPTKTEKTTLRNSGIIRESKPAISEHWQRLFPLQPQLHQPSTAPYFDKEEYRLKVGEAGNEEGIYEHVLRDVEEEW